MIPAEHDKESFQVTIVFGFFKSEREADNYRRQFVNKPEYISGETKGSWHKMTICNQCGDRCPEGEIFGKGVCVDCWTTDEIDKAFKDILDAGPGAICGECGHLAARHGNMMCYGIPDKPPCQCKGMLWGQDNNVRIAIVDRYPQREGAFLIP